jgi:eukaryotic-like serine/threonine-protein kinase
VGTVLRSRYRLDRLLGVGGMAAVYHATHRNGAELAIKVLHEHLSSDAQVRERFLKEGLAANSVRHPGAVAVLDDDVAEDGTAFLVMELLRGADAEALRLTSGGKLPTSAVLSIADQLLDVLVAAQGEGIVHRDIKPANLFVTTEGQLRVLDFGVAWTRDAAEDVVAGDCVLGTPAFMPPEQALGAARGIDPRSDVWSAAAALFMLLGGQTVHEAQSAQQMLAKAATVRARSLHAVVPGAPQGLVDAIDRALAFDPTARPDAATFRELLQDVSQRMLGQPPSRRTLEALVRGACSGRGEDEGEPAAQPGVSGCRPAQRRLSTPWLLAHEGWR